MTIQEIKQLNPRRYYIDFDSTIVNSVKAMVRILNRTFEMDVNYRYINKWDFSDQFPVNSDFIEHLFSSQIFFDNAEFYDGALEFLKENVDNITIISKGGRINLELKCQFLAKHGLSAIKFIGLPLNKSKSCVDMTDCVFIDDVTENIKNVNATYKIQFREFEEDKMWNSGWNGEILKDWK